MSGIQFERKIQTHGQTQNKYKYKDKYKKNRQTYDVTFLWKVDDKRILKFENTNTKTNAKTNTRTTDRNMRLYIFGKEMTIGI